MEANLEFFFFSIIRKITKLDFLDSTHTFLVLRLSQYLNGLITANYCVCAFNS